jgi:hypothetical protein
VSNRAQRRRKPRAKAGDRRRKRVADRLGVPVQDKQHVDAMNAVSLELFGLGIGVLVQEEARQGRNEAAARAERAEIAGFRILGVLWPVSRWWTLWRMEHDAQKMREQWHRRLERVAEEVARGVPIEVLRARSERWSRGG